MREGDAHRGFQGPTSHEVGMSKREAMRRGP